MNEGHFARESPIAEASSERNENIIESTASKDRPTGFDEQKSGSQHDDRGEIAGQVTSFEIKPDTAVSREQPRSPEIALSGQSSQYANDDSEIGLADDAVFVAELRQLKRILSREEADKIVKEDNLRDLKLNSASKQEEEKKESQNPAEVGCLESNFSERHC